MGYKRLFPADLTEDHLRLLVRALEWSPGATMESWCSDLVRGEMQLYDLGTGLIGVQVLPDLTWVILVVGKDLIPRAQEISNWVKSFGNPVETNVTRKGLVRVYERLGWKSLGTWMRL